MQQQMTSIASPVDDKAVFSYLQLVGILQNRVGQKATEVLLLFDEAKVYEMNRGSFDPITRIRVSPLRVDIMCGRNRIESLTYKQLCEIMPGVRYITFPNAKSNADKILKEGAVGISIDTKLEVSKSGWQYHKIKKVDISRLPQTTVENLKQERTTTYNDYMRSIMRIDGSAFMDE